ncbi:DNA translocase FtsK [Planococcus sp. ISL-109]|uniref:DNA translocase FtsK n=1 Tax=Planococcus sp. ISL-109 TaxID=2819166 RepID=UPI001BE5B2FC|nr:DNA translocase FtsK [Planococcus sp. ISL-109]MBT2582550.1 DUF87 domain-containing protein [Planococcus sp. ISL-109]
MSWMKNMWNKMFADEVEVDAKPERRSDEFQAEPKTQKAPGKPAPFRFPLISDEEAKGLPQAEEQAERRTEKPRVEEMPKEESLNTYELEALEPSGKLPKPNTGRNKKKRPHVPKINEPHTLDLPVNTTRRFQPTRVPSPVHGFTDRPAPIDKLLQQEAERKQAEHERRYDWSQRSLQELYKKSGSEQAASVTPPASKVAVSHPVTETKQEVEVPSAEELREETVKQNDSQQDEVKAEPKYEWADRSLQDLLPKNQKKEKAQEQTEAVVYRPAAQQQPAVDQSASEKVQEHHETPEPTPEEPKPEEIVEPLPEQLEPKHEAVPETSVEESVHTEKRPPILPQAQKIENGKKERTVPFNVLMLKSDKERLSKPLPPSAEKKTALIEKTEPEEDVDDTISLKSYQLPSPEFLLAPENDLKDETWMDEQGKRLIEALSHFQIKADILGTVQGPAVTRFELRVAQGIKVSKIRNLADDLKLALAARDIRIQAPIPGKSSIGIEIPNRQSRAVRISEVIGSPAFLTSESPLEAALGLDLAGNPVTLDLRKMPHGLIAGATGSGKSVCINSLLVSLLYKSSPRDLKMLLIDPKMVELAPYNHIPHLVSPVITDVKAATASLKWAVEEMERRYQLFAHTGVRDLERYNKMVNDKGQPAQHLPYILIVIDELADLMMMSPSDVEDAICRIAQKARACGIHLVIATQRPSVDVITGLIKSNIPTRIAFSVASQVDSRTILDTQGAERLLGRGDMLYLGNGMSAPSRLQGTFVTDDEIEKVIAHARSQGEPDYFFKEEELIQRSHSPAEQDDLFEEACRFIMSQGSASTSLLQRKFHIGYNRAARLMDLIEDYGFISEQNGSKARAVLITEEEIEEVFH